MKSTYTIKVVFLCIAALAGSCAQPAMPPTIDREARSTPRSHSEMLVANEKKWTKLNIRNYEFELSAEGYLRAFEPTVVVTVRDSRLVSIRTPDGKPVEYPRIYQEFSSVDELYKFLSRIIVKNPERFHVSYDEEKGFPAYVDLDEMKGIADDELTVRVTNLKDLN